MTKAKDADPKNPTIPERAVWLPDGTGSEWAAKRKELGLSQRALARRVGVSSGTVSNIETGKQHTLDRSVYAKWRRLLFRDGAAIPDELWDELVNVFSDVDEEEAKKLIAIDPMLKQPRPK